ncbi:MAG: hypothetical protein IJP90_14925 [Treponema sp.]|nr:hypothetical protein [Treponema sp.]
MTASAKEKLDYTDEDNGRFIEINYQNHILPFLQECLKKTEFTKELCLKTALFQYIDYLKGRFGMRENDLTYNAAVIEKLTDVLGIKTKIGKERYNAIEKIQNDIYNFLNIIKIKPLMETANKIKSFYGEDANRYKPFNNVRLWNEGNNVVVVFENFSFVNISYKLDVAVFTESFKLTLKHDNNRRIDRTEKIFIKFIRELSFSADSLSKDIPSNRFEEVGCELKSELETIFTALINLQEKI